MLIGAVALALTVASGCSSNTRDAARTVKVADTAAPTGPVLLAAFDTGVGAVTSGAPAPLWLEPDAVAAADGTSVFSVRHSPDDADRLVRLDPQTGAVMLSWALTTPGLSVAAVAPKARWIALTDRKARVRQPRAGRDQGRRLRRERRNRVAPPDAHR